MYGAVKFLMVTACCSISMLVGGIMAERAVHRAALAYGCAHYDTQTGVFNWGASEERTCGVRAL